MKYNRLQEWMLNTIQNAVDNGDYKKAIDLSVRYLKFTDGGEDKAKQIQISNLKEYSLLHIRLQANERN
jgi:hypothetical protein